MQLITDCSFFVLFHSSRVSTRLQCSIHVRAYTIRGVMSIFDMDPRVRNYYCCRPDCPSPRIDGKRHSVPENGAIHRNLLRNFSSFVWKDDLFIHESCCRCIRPQSTSIRLTNQRSSGAIQSRFPSSRSMDTRSYRPVIPLTTLAGVACAIPGTGAACS